MRNVFHRIAFLFVCILLTSFTQFTWCETLEIKSAAIQLSVDDGAGWALSDLDAGVRWPSQGWERFGIEKEGASLKAERKSSNRIIVSNPEGGSVEFSLEERGRCVTVRYDGVEGDIRVLGDALRVSRDEDGYLIVPCREGLLIPADSGKTFKHTFGASDYEGCHMFMMGFHKSGASLLFTWDDAYVRPEVESRLLDNDPQKQAIDATVTFSRTARSFQLRPLGKSDWNQMASAYRRVAEKKGYAVTLKQKIRRDPHLEKLLGACDAKLWTCLARRMNDDSTAEESVKVHWTFDEAARIAEHLSEDLKIDRCLFMVGGWTEGGYDCRHPDNLPANPECGGNDALADAMKRIQDLGYVGCLHDNYQDMYKDARSWDPKYIQKRPDGTLAVGGRWLGGRAYIVCAKEQVGLAMRPQNLPETKKLFDPWSYFIDTTYAAGPQECFDENHPLTKNDDIEWKSKLSDAARDVFGIFGSECGREWALPHSDFFEGLVGVSGTYYHQLKPEELGAVPIPFWEMVYHDCEVCYGKYGYDFAKAGEFVAHHALAARTMYYHSFPDHLYWTRDARPRELDAAGCYARSDGGWADGMHPYDAFIKNTQEALGPLNRLTAHMRLERLEFLTPDRGLRKATYGNGRDAVTVVANLSDVDREVTSQWGGDVILPAWGFCVDAPRFTAFYATRWNGREYPGGALFTIQPEGRSTLDKAKKVRIFHGFGDAVVSWRGENFSVPREGVVEPGREY
ncbi:MAG: hypothetical protein GC154_00595 [bacterium]|nr:hypothetical protein [bacterium]